MSQKISPLQVYQGKSWAGLTTANHLGTIFQEQPHLASMVMSRVFGMHYYMGLDTIISMMGAEKEMPDDRDFEWYLKGDDEKAIRVVSYSALDVNRPGISNSEFTITFAEKFFSDTDLLVADDRRYRVRVMGEPTPNGTNWDYRVVLFSGDPTLFVPPALLTADKQFSKDYSPQEDTLSKSGGTTNYTSPFKMRNSFSTLRKQNIVPSNMIDRPLVIDMLDPKTDKRTKIWTQYAEWVFLCQWYKEKNRNLLYATSNKTDNGTYLQKGKSGFVIKEGAGLREQISPAYKFNYTKFTIDYLTEVLLNLSINILPEDKRHFVALTGERGFVQFHKALEDKAAIFQPLDTGRVAGSGQNLRFQGQYREFWGPQGVKFTLMHLPEYDNPVTNRLPHPDGGFTENYRYTILNFGTTEGEANIQRLYPKGEREVLWHIPGSHSPYGPKGSFKEASSSAVAGYEVHAMCKQAVMLKNPLSCAELIPSVATV